MKKMNDYHYTSLPNFRVLRLFCLAAALSEHRLQYRTINSPYISRGSVLGNTLRTIGLGDSVRVIGVYFGSKHRPACDPCGGEAPSTSVNVSRC